MDGKTPVPVDLHTWALWIEENRDKKRIAHTTVGPIRISTVFLGLNHQWEDDKPPLIFETMIFGGPLDQEGWRCSTWDEAEKQHAAAVKLADAHGRRYKEKT